MYAGFTLQALFPDMDEAVAKKWWPMVQARLNMSR
jgi:hypothetical protein